jgi:hypothetical protein
MTPHRLSLAVLTAVLLSALPGRAADLDPYLPEDSETVVNLNVRQILDSSLVKKHVLDLAQEALRGNDQAQDVLKDLGLDPFKDIDRLIAAAPGGTDKDRGLLILRGRFDLAKFRAKAEQVVKDNDGVLKIHKILGDKHTLYEVNVPDLDYPLFVALPDDRTLVVSAGKDYVVDALKKAGKSAQPVLKNKDFQGLLEKVDDRQSLSIAFIKTDAVRDALSNLPGDVKDMIDKVQALGGGLKLTDDVQLELVVSTKTAREARELRDSADAGLKLVLAGLAAITTNQKDEKPGLEFLLAIAKSLSVKSKGETVVIKGTVNSDILEEMMKKAK